MADQELKKAFVELQTKMMETNQRVTIAQAQIDNLKRSNMRITLTNQELKELPAETKAYESIGRIKSPRNITKESSLRNTWFMLQSVSDVCQNLMAKKQNNEERIKTQEGNISQWTGDLKQSEENLREMIALHREK